MRFVLLHSPLVGPATWRWVAEALRASGHHVAVPDLRRAAVGWCGTPACFLLLSHAYRRDADRASTLGWPVIEHLGTHLDIVNHPKPLARHLVEIVL